MKPWRDLTSDERIQRLSEVVMKQERQIEMLLSATNADAKPGMTVLRLKMSQRGENDYLGAWPHLDQKAA